MSILPSFLAAGALVLQVVLPGGKFALKFKQADGVQTPLTYENSGEEAIVSRFSGE